MIVAKLPIESRDDGAGALPESVARFRAEYRAHEIGAQYSGLRHAAITFGGGSLAIVAVLLQLDAVRAAEWLVLPLTFLYANLAEYLGHRFPMHRPFPGLELIYRRHAGQHHRFFTDRAMPYENTRDLRAVLFPPLLVVFFFGLFAAPLGVVLALLVSANVAWLAVAMGIAYFLNYEILHLAYHAPPGHWLARLPGVARLSALHTRHHDPNLMARYNFNITYPIGDRLFGTLLSISGRWSRSNR
jgi:hypothetical protein